MIFKKKQDAAVQQTAAGEAKPAAKGGKAAAFFRKNWKWMVPVVCVAVLGGWFILRPDKAQNANTDINYVQVSPSKRDVSNTLSGTGTLNPANTYNVKSLVAGKVLTSSFEEGDIVEEGTVLYTVDSSDATTKAEQASIALQQAQRSYDKTADRQYVRAEVAGVVSALKVAKGDEVTSGQEVAVIRDSSKMVLRLEFPAADAAGKTWEYAKEKQVVPAESRFAELDCAMWGAAEPGGTGFAASFKRRLEAGTGSDFLYLHGFDQLESSVQAEAVRFLTAVLPELGAKYPRLIFGVQTVPPSLKNSVPVQAELLPLRSRSLLEKKRLIYRFLMQEEQRIGRRAQVTGQAYQMLMQYPYERNVGQLEQVIRTSCTNAYSRSRDGDICIGLPVLPDAVFESCLLLPEAGAQNRALTLDDLREDCGFEREHHLLEEIREQGRLYLQGSLECAGFCTRMVHRLEEYNNYILFQNKIADERIKGIEQGMLRISERIHELYGVGFPNSFILMLARWVYFGNVFDDALPEDSAEMQQLVADLTEAVRRDAPYSFAVASDLLLMVQNTTDVHFSSIGILMISAFVEVLHRHGNKLPVQALIICHGYATASSIADVCNKMLHKYLFNAIDMPYDVPVSEIVSQVKKILYFNENRDVLILVDLGSLENITELLDDLPNVNLGIINNVSTAMALSVGSHILDGMPLAEVLENAKNASQIRYKILEKARKEDVILFVSESGSNVASKVSELFMHSLNHLNTKVNARFLCYDVQTYEQLRQNGHWDTCNVLFGNDLIRCHCRGRDPDRRADRQQPQSGRDRHQARRADPRGARA